MRDQIYITGLEAAQLKSDVEVRGLAGVRMRDAGWPVRVSPIEGRIIFTAPGMVEQWIDPESSAIYFRWTPADNLSPARDSQTTAPAGILQRIRAAGRKLGAWRPF